MQKLSIAIGLLLALLLLSGGVTETELTSSGKVLSVKNIALMK